MGRLQPVALLLDKKIKRYAMFGYVYPVEQVTLEVDCPNRGLNILSIYSKGLLLLVDCSCWSGIATVAKAFVDQLRVVRVSGPGPCRLL